MPIKPREKRKNQLTLTDLLMDGLGYINAQARFAKV